QRAVGQRSPRGHQSRSFARGCALDGVLAGPTPEVVAQALRRRGGAWQRTARAGVAPRVADASPPRHARRLPRLPRGVAQAGRDRRRLLPDQDARGAPRWHRRAAEEVPAARGRGVPAARRPSAGDPGVRSDAAGARSARPVGGRRRGLRRGAQAGASDGRGRLSGRGGVMVDRLAMLQRMVETRSDDPFPRYGLAMEHRGRGDVAAATATFEALLERFPNYVPAYLMFGQMVRDAGDATRAGD